MSVNTSDRRGGNFFCNWLRLLPLQAVALLMLLLATSPSRIQAAPITASQAEAVVNAWFAADGNPMNTGISQSIGDVMAYPGEDGITNAFYVVSLRPAGYVIVAADDLAGSVISFSSKGAFSPSPNSTLYRLLQLDLPQRVAIAKAPAAKPALQAQLVKSQALPGKGMGTTIHPMDVSHPIPASSICRVRVPPMITSHWSQNAPYNSYTPSNAQPGIAAVCVAELMRFSRWPTNGIVRKTYLDYVNETPTWVWTGGGDGTGGPYQWDSMVDDATASGTTLAQQQAVARLCADVGVAVSHEHYDVRHSTDRWNSGLWGTLPDGTPWTVTEGLQSVYGFSNGGYLNAYNGDDPTWWGDEALKNAPDVGGSLSMINANLDAGFPVLMTLWIHEPAGSSMICDGYGYSLGGVTVDGVTAKSGMYHHMNLADGNSSDDIWYTLPVVQGGAGFTNILAIGFNIMPRNSGEIVSGRVVDQDEISMPGITMQITDGASYTNTTVTTNTGIYSFIVPANADYTISVVTNFGGPVVWPSPSRTVHVGQSTMWGTCGNVWGVNFYVTSHLIGGQVLTTNGVPLIGAQVIFSNIMQVVGSPSTLVTNSLLVVATDLNGNFVLPVPNHWTGTVTPILPNLGGTFTPAFTNLTGVTADNTNILFTWNAPTFFAISGTVFRADTLDNVTNAVITFEGSGASAGVNISVGSDPEGNYVAFIPTNWSGVATPTHADGGFFSPSSKAYTNLAGNIGFQCYFWSPPLTNTISGVVIRRDTGALVAGAQVQTSDGSTYETDDNGFYSVPVPYGWNGSISMGDPFGGVFLPAGRGYSSVNVPVAGQNYLWTPPLPTITGVVTSANAPYGPVSNVTIALSGNAGRTVTAVDGTYRLHAPFFGWSGTATPTNPAGGIFSPAQMPAIDTSTSFVFTQNYAWTAPTQPTTYSISGSIFRADNEQPVNNAWVVFAGTGSPIPPAYTDPNGNYVAYAPANWTGVATPVHPHGGSFAPANWSYSNLTASTGFCCYYWSPPLTNTISGTVIMRNTGQPAVGVQLQTSDGRTFATDANGAYSIPVPYQWSGTVTLSSPVGGVFLPLGQTYVNVLVPVSGQDYLWTPPPPYIFGTVFSTNYPAGPVSNVVIRYAGVMAGYGAITGQTVTAADGSYHVNVPVGWVGTATPSNLLGGTFTPSSMPVIDTHTNYSFMQNYIWIPPSMFAVSGSVIRAGTLADVTDALITYTGTGAFVGINGTTPTDASGNYQFYVPANWTGSTLAWDPNSGSFSPAGFVYSSGITNDTGYQTFLWTPPSTNAISGTVLRRDNGQPAAGVQIQTSDGITVVTDANGMYSIPIPYEWSGVVTPSSAFGGVFRPANQSYSALRASARGQDYLWTPPAPIIVGSVTNTSAPFGFVPNVTIVFSGSSFTQTVTSTDGSYRVSLPVGWIGTATPSHPWGGVFSPAHMPLVNMSTNFIFTQNYAWTPPPMLMISGSVWRSDTLGNVTNAVINFSGGILPVNTDANGNYLAFVPPNWTGTVTPQHPDLGNFSPRSRSYTNLAANIGFQTYLWTPPLTNTISGTVIRRDTGAPVAGAQLQTADGLTATTDTNGNYVIPSVPYQWAGTVVPSHALGGIFSPVSQSYSDVRASIGSQNYQWIPPPPVITGMVTRADYPFGPAAGVTITLSGNAGTTVTAADGGYRLNVGVGWVGTITPSHAAGGVFTPASSATIDSTTNIVLRQDFQWLPPPLTISGLVTRADDHTPVSNVVNITFINASNAPALAPVISLSPSTVHTDTNGMYSFTVPFGWVGVAKPSHPAGGFFTPASNAYVSITVSHLSDNYAWTPPPPSIIGRVVRFDSGAAVTNVSVIFSNDASLVTLGATNPLAVVVTDSNGVYQATVGSGWTGTVTPLITQYVGAVFAPGQRAFTNVQADVTDTNRTQFVLYPPPARLVTLVSPAYRGTISGATSGWYTVGAALSITAMPNSVSRFLYWQEDSVSNAARTVVLAPGTNTYTAILIDLGPTISFIGLDASGGINFSNVLVGQSVTRKFTVKNTGTSICNILGAATPSAFFALPNSYSLNPGATRIVSMVFTPPAIASFTGQVVFATYPEPVAGPPSFFVQGTGIGLSDVLTFTGSVDFGTVLVGQSVTRSLRIYNQSAMALTINARWNNGAGYTVSGLPATIPAGGFKNITIKLAPTLNKDYNGAILTFSATGVATTCYLVPTSTVLANVGGTWSSTINNQGYSLYLRQAGAVVDGILVCRQNTAINDQYVAGATAGSLTGVLYYASNTVGGLQLTATASSTLTGVLVRTGIGLGGQPCKWTRSSSTVPSSVHFVPRPAVIAKSSVKAASLAADLAAPSASLKFTLLDMSPAALLPEDSELVVVAMQNGHPVTLSPALERLNLSWLLQTRMDAAGADLNTNGVPDLIEAAVGVPLTDGMELLIVRTHAGFAVPAAPLVGTHVEGAAVPLGVVPATWTLSPRP